MHTPELFDLVVRDIEQALADTDKVRENLEGALATFKDAKFRELDPLEVVPLEPRVGIAREYVARLSAGLGQVEASERKLKGMLDALNGNTDFRRGNPRVGRNGERF